MGVVVKATVNSLHGVMFDARTKIIYLLGRESRDLDQIRSMLT